YVLGVSVVSGQPPRVIERGVQVRQDDLFKHTRRHDRCSRPATSCFYSPTRASAAQRLVGNRPGPPTVCMSEMALVGRLPPVIAHFPIALVTLAGAAAAAGSARCS